MRACFKASQAFLTTIFVVFSVYSTVHTTVAGAATRSDDPVEIKVESIQHRMEKSFRRRSFVSPVDREDLNYLKWEKAIGSSERPILYLPGRGETSFQWIETAVDMRFDHRFHGATYILDHRGQGFSRRMDPKNPQVGDVKKFDHYVKDVIAMIDMITQENRGRRPYVMAHSMGAMIMATALLERPDLTDKVVFVTPMIDINLGVVEMFGEGLAGVLIGTMATVNPKLVLGARAQPVSVNDPLQVRTNDPVQAEARWRLLNRYRTYMPGKTIRWVNENLKATKNFFRHAAEVETEVLMIAGEHDQVVEIERMRQVQCLMPNCQLLELPGAFHALHEERKELSDAMKSDSAAFFRGEPLGACEALMRVAADPSMGIRD